MQIWDSLRRNFRCGEYSPPAKLNNRKLTSVTTFVEGPNGATKAYTWLVEDYGKAECVVKEAQRNLGLLPITFNNG